MITQHKESIRVIGSLLVSLGLGGLASALWIGFTARVSRHAKGAPLFVPFRAGHLPDNRGDAFGVVIPDAGLIPLAQSFVWIQIGKSSELFKVRGVETLTTIDGMKALRAPEVYIVVDANLTDEQINTVNTQHGFTSTSNRLPPTPKREAKIESMADRRTKKR